ncbi:Response regulator PleD [Burkholderiales bacterium]|nr:MAG: diguanylate cyclase [Burkholderiales bacterium]CAG0950146.1 Response regulator PleD [Burkholderiales bacterium]
MPNSENMSLSAHRAWEMQHAQPAQAHALASEALANAQAQGDALAASWARLTLCYLRLRQEDYAAARDDLVAAAEVFARHGDARGHLLASNGLARLAMLEGDLENALASFRANLREDGGTLSALDRFYTLNGVAGCFAALGDAPQALAHLFEALEALRSIDAKPQLAALLTNLGSTLMAVGDLDEARRSLEEAAQLAKTLRHPRLNLEIAANLAECLLHLGLAKEALPLARRLMRDPEALTAANREGNVFTAAALVFLANGRTADAGEALTRAETLADKHASPEARVWTLYLRGLGHALRGERGQAIARLGEARQQCTAHTPHRLRGFILEKLSAILAEASRYQEAYELHRAFFAVYEERLGLAARARYHALQLRQELSRLRLERDLAREEARRDPLTGLNNRRHLDAVLEELLALFSRTRQPLTLALLDLDHFKLINDTHGHAFGDEVLRALARLLVQGLRAQDVVCRIGGEEFCLVFANASPADARHRLEHLLQTLRGTTIRFEDREAQGLSFSAGLAAFPEDGRLPLALIAAADRALYRAKHEGRARVCEAGPIPPEPSPPRRQSSPPQAPRRA